MEKKALKDLDKLFYPDSVAVIGASKNTSKAGNVWLNNFIRYGFQGKIYPINPSEEEILGLKVYKSVMDVPDKVDQALFTVPAPVVVKAMEDCGRKGVKVGVVHSTGFAEAGEEGKLMQQRLVEIAKNNDIRVIGPNCVGILCPESRVAWARPHTFPEKAGGVAVVSQSGGGGGYFVNLASEHGVNFSKVISIGNECDVSVLDFMEYFQEDPKTDILFIYLEGFRDGRRFVEIAKNFSLRKPAVVYKIGRTEVGGRAAASHTGSIAGSLDIYDGAFRQTGVFRAGDIEEALDILVVFSNVWFKQGVPRGPRVGIISGPGGPGVATADSCIEAGLQVLNFSDETTQKLAEIIPSASRTNPTDVDLGVKTKEHFAARVEIIEHDENVDMLAIVGPGESNPQGTMEEMLKIQEMCTKPFIVIWPSAGKDVEACKEVLRQKGVPLFLTPKRGGKALGALMQYKRALGRLKEEVGQ